MPTFAQIDRHVERLLAADLASSRPPVDVEAIANRLGAIIRRASFDKELSGALSRGDGGTPVIAVSIDDGDLRQRFTIAHEIGHLVLHDAEVHVDQHFLGTGLLRPTALHHRKAIPTPDRKEVEANHFAAALLMPEGLLRQEVEPKPLRDEDVRALAKRFQVSQQAMGFRLLNLGFQLELA